MTPDLAPGTDHSKSGGHVGGLADLPASFPPWARQLAELYFSGTTSAFVLHGNTYDFVRSPGRDSEEFVGLVEFLAEQLFGRWSLVLHYDLGRGLRVAAGRDEQRLKEMVTLANRKLGDLSTLSKEPSAAIALLDRFVRNNLMAADADRLSMAVIVDQASYVFPAGDPGRLSPQASSQLVTMINWATSPHVKRLNMAFVLVDEKRADLSERLTANPHVASIEVPLPAEAERVRFVNASVDPATLTAFSDYDAVQLAAQTAGISLTDLNVIVQSAREGGRRLDAKVFRELKKLLIERQCHGLLEFIEPKWTLDTVVGHEAAKARLREDAALLKRGALDSLPMGYLICGPVGTGKSFLAQCVSGEIGAPCVMLKNFRSKYVGETEGNLERVLSVLRAMGPVVVVVDEADAALGGREQDGDSGTSSRVFGMIAAQMGDTRYRGRIVWMLLTARPDLLPIDLKRQGRAEVHIPLFYPSDEGEIRQMFTILATKMGSRVAPDDIPPIPQRGQLSGADIEGMVGRAWRKSLLAGQDRITREALADVVSQFMPSTQGMERELQEIAAVIECTDRQFLPPAILDRIDKEGGRATFQARLTALKQILKDL
ncbi:MAG TPA: AAA family ATPase [Vicinamibacterales bacterium]|jgi:AAA+ superfamily predicted ATPase|nr:AAA family ATPase [Vicinamibacterales bacterium]